jgi:hypothetical protein
MYNLVQAQEALQGMPTNDVMKYANQQNPQVPAYLALAELNRRKQLEQTESQFSGQPQTVKQQIEGAFTQAPPGQVNPGQAPRMANPAGAPTGQVNPTNLPPQLAPTMPVPTMPTQAPQAPGAVNPVVGAPLAPPRGMAEGGLAALPIHRMFSSDSYATGGIVAFGDPNLNPNEDQLVPSAAEIEAAKKPYVGYRMPPRVAGEPPKQYPESNFLSNLGKKIGEFLLPSDYAVDKPRQKFDPTVFDREDMENGKAAPISLNNFPPAAPPRPPRPSAPPAAPAATAPSKPTLAPATLTAADLKEMTPEDAYARIKKMQELAGVSQDPFAESKRRYAKIEEQQLKDEAEDPQRQLMATLRGIAAAPGQYGWANALGQGSEANAKFEKENTALRTQQHMKMAELNQNMEKEDDARRRGDVKGMEEAIAAQTKNKIDLAKLQNESVTAAAHAKSADAAMISAQRGHAPNAIQSFEALYGRNPDLAKMYLGQGKTGAMTLEEAFKTVQTDPLAATMSEDQKWALAQQRYQRANGMSAGVGTAPVVTTKDQFDKLPSGTIYTGKDGMQYRKP